MILVTGATGTVGRVVVDRLLSAGRPVRALTRDPARAGLPAGAETVRGDLTRPEELADVLAGVDRMYYLPALDEEDAAAHAKSFLALAIRAGVRRIVMLSGLAVAVGRPGSFELLYEIEQLVEASGAEWTHLRPGEFAVNKLDVWAESVRTEGVIRNAFPDGLGAPVHEADIAEVAVAALLEDGHAGRAYALSGPVALSHRDQAAAVAEGLGRPIRFEALTYGQARASYINAGFPPEIAEYVLGYQAEYAEEPPVPSDDVRRVLGRPARSLAEWAADHADDFS
ncbi:NAD(P)H-binding protein [Allonocardiopsis opalescens]|uniref:Uncharacterized protein YbjT (DUF2867 family) n=1 Tax=Allonocardiopsis opalescens TaxID=1144618 RepID=A0A2T0Q7L1_9ACTN|nr:NAD(P)H-binding protein [Allonocardiopsis opalescens]PRX99817.1 uncharacterized protein YbjT (DUF2867 family) [Allonocardiopsis opalescens]